MACYQLHREQFVPKPRAEVFAFFSDARNLEAITPGFLNFRITTPGSIAIAAGTLIDYRLRLFGVPFSWRTQIETFEPSDRFSDVQLRGPYKLWHHTHEFFDAPGGTRMTDHVEYELPLGPMGTIAHALVIRRMLGKIFDFRRDEIAKLFPAA